MESTTTFVDLFGGGGKEIKLNKSNLNIQLVLILHNERIRLSVKAEKLEKKKKGLQKKIKIWTQTILFWTKRKTFNKPLSFFILVLFTETRFKTVHVPQTLYRKETELQQIHKLQQFDWFAKGKCWVLNIYFVFALLCGLLYCGGKGHITSPACAT